eukprot:6193243-Pleurochrysis_carterae.AAC.1
MGSLKRTKRPLRPTLAGRTTGRFKRNRNKTRARRARSPRSGAAQLAVQGCVHNDSPGVSGRLGGPLPRSCTSQAPETRMKKELHMVPSVQTVR